MLLRSWIHWDPLPDRYLCFHVEVQAQSFEYTSREERRKALAKSGGEGVHSWEPS